MSDMPPADPSASVDYILRTAQQNTLQLSAMADQKASVVLGASFVTASIVFGDITGSSDLELASALLAVTAVVSGLFAALSVIPRINSSAVSAGRVNLLFFAAIADLEHDDYFHRMRTLISDREAMYEAVIEDLYQASLVLKTRKYPLLRASYIALTCGMMATLVAVLVT